MKTNTHHIGAGTEKSSKPEKSYFKMTFTPQFFQLTAFIFGFLCDFSVPLRLCGGF